MPKNKTSINAFSLIELLIAITIVAVMLLTALPSLQEILGKNRALTYAHEITTMLQLARMTAIKLGKPVIFCGSNDRHTCNDSWQHGSIIITADGQVIRIVSAVPIGDKLTWHGSFNTKNIITFLPSGFPNGQQGSFYYCPRDSASNAIAIILSLTGRIRNSHKTADAKIIPCNF